MKRSTSRCTLVARVCPQTCATSSSVLMLPSLAAFSPQHRSPRIFVTNSLPPSLVKRRPISRVRASLSSRAVEPSPTHHGRRCANSQASKLGLVRASSNRRLLATLIAFESSLESGDSTSTTHQISRYLPEACSCLATATLFIGPPPPAQIIVKCRSSAPRRVSCRMVSSC